MRALGIIVIVLMGCNALAIIPDKERTDLDSSKKEILFYKAEAISCSGAYMKQKNNESVPHSYIRRKKSVGIRCYFKYLNFPW